MREDLSIVRSDAPSRVLAEFERNLPARQITKTASAQSTRIRLAEATEQGFKRLAFDIYENPDYGTLWKLEEVDGEPWLVTYTDDDDNIIRKVASRLAAAAVAPEEEFSARAIAEVVGRLKLAQNPPMSPSEDVAPMGYNVRSEENKELSDPEIKQFFEEKDEEEKPAEDEVKVTTTPTGGDGSGEEKLEMTFPDRVKHIKIDLEGEEGEEEESIELPEGAATPPTGTPTLPEGAPGPGLGGEVPVTF